MSLTTMQFRVWQQTELFSSQIRHVRDICDEKLKAEAVEWPAVAE
jgi:hypothetical protein